MTFNFKQFCMGLRKVKFKNTNRSQEIDFTENVLKLQFAWNEGNQADVKSIAAAISENIKLCNVDIPIKTKLAEIKAGKEKPPPISKLPERNTHPTTSTTDVPNKPALTWIKQKANEKELESIKIQLSDLAKDVNDLHGLIFKTKEKLPPSHSSDHIIEQIRTHISKIKDEVSKRENDLKRCKEEHIDNLKQVYRDVMKTDYKANPKTDMVEQMTCDFMDMIESKTVEFTKELYKDIKGREFSKRQTSAVQREDKKGNTGDADGGKLITKIKNELKEDLNRLKEVTPQLEKMFHGITGRKYVPKGESLQGKRPQDLDELGIVLDMTHQLTEFIAIKLSCQDDSSVVETELKRLYIIITGDDEKGPNASLSKSDIRTFFDDVGSELFQAIKKKESELFADVEMILRSMYGSLFGKSYETPKKTPPSTMSSVTSIIRRTTNELMDYKSEASKKISQQEQELKFCKMKLRETEGDLQKTIQDREEYRLSKVAGARFAQVSPEIVELSDQNRPTKLAEKYSELYDNGWTDAFDIIARSNSDEKTTEILLDVLKAAYVYCSEASGKQDVLLKTTLLKPKAVISMIEEQERAILKDIKALEKDSKKMIESMGIEVMQLLTDMRKSSWKQTLRNLSGDFKPTVVIEYRKNEHVTKYVQECLELTWLMVLQSPPLVLDDSVTKKGNFDKTKYREYTQSGKKFDYLVWPALLICKGGSILQKGVAQGLK